MDLILESNGFDFEIQWKLWVMKVGGVWEGGVVGRR